MSIPPLPEENESGEIGHLAVKGFQAQTPESWRIKDLSGDSDVGLDMLVNVVSAGKYSFIFHAQIKGSSIDCSNATGEFFSVALKVSTAHYLQRAGTPIMLVLSDQSTGQRTQSPLYFLWIHKELPAVLGRLQPDARGDSVVTFRIPAGNILNRSLDVVPNLTKWKEEEQSLEGLERAIVASSVTVPSVDVIQRVTENVKRGGACFVDSIQFANDLPWADAAPGTIGWRLRQLNDSISNGDSTWAEKSVVDLSNESITDPIAMAELEHQRGRLESLVSGIENAKPYFESAFRIQPRNPRYLCAKYEADLLAGAGIADWQRMYVEVTGNDLADNPRVKALRARLLNLQDRYTEASALLEGLPEQHAIVERAIGKYFQRLPDEVAAIARTADVATTSRFTLLTLRIIALRARFESLFRASNESIIPASGPPGVAAKDLQTLWSEVRQLANDLRERGWPQNSQVLMEILMPSGLAVGRPEETLVLLDDFLCARPHLVDLQLNRMMVAMFANRFDIALDAVSRLSEPEKTIQGVLVRYVKQDLDGVCAQIPKLLEITDTTAERLGEALAVAALAAHSTFNANLSNDCILRCEPLSDSGPILAVFNFVRRASAGDGKALTAAIEELWEAYERSRDSRIVQDQIFHALRPLVADEARRAIEVSVEIQKRRQLFGSEVTHLALCLRELGDLAVAIALLDEARIRLPNDVEIPALLALILEDSGQAGRALAVLDALLSNHSDAPEMARAVYINIAARNGLIDAAITQFHKQLSDRPTSESRREIFRALFSLELHRKADPNRAVTIAYQYGSCVDQDDELQEGIFLQFVATCSTIPGVNFIPSQLEDFDRRSKKYVQKYPDSRYFSMLPIQAAGDPAEFIRAVRAKVGLTEERLRGIESLANGLERGTFPIPYALRPRRILLNVGSVPHLWELTKRTKLPAASFHLLVNRELQEPRDLRDLRGKVPLMDSVTLLLASDLGILDLLFTLYGQIAVPKSTLLSIQKEAGHLGLQTESVLKLRSTLTEKMKQVIQPGKISAEGSPRRLSDEFEDFESLATDPRFVLYTDDVCLRILALGDDNFTSGLTTPDILESAEKAGILALRESAKLYSVLAGWNIGHIPITMRHFLAAVPLKVNDFPTVASKIEQLSSDAAFKALADAVWDHLIPYDNARNQVVNVVTAIFRGNPDADDKLVAAIISFWLDKVSLRPQPQLSRVEHLAHVFVRAFIQLRSPDPAPRHLWNSFKLVLERIHRDRMDDPRLRDAINVVAGLIASAPNSNQELAAAAGDLLERLLNAMVGDGRDSKQLNEAYQDARVQHALRELNSN